MFSLYSKGCEYAILALSVMAAETHVQKFRARDICRRAGIPESYARKTFQALVQNGFLKAVPGPGGGYSVAGDLRKLTVLDVIEAVEGPQHFSKCVLRFSACDQKNPCSLHAMWTGLKITMLEELKRCRISALTEKSPVGKPRRA